MIDGYSLLGNGLAQSVTNDTMKVSTQSLIVAQHYSISLSTTGQDMLNERAVWFITVIDRFPLSHLED